MAVDGARKDDTLSGDELAAGLAAFDATVGEMTRAIEARDLAGCERAAAHDPDDHRAIMHTQCVALIKLATHHADIDGALASRR